VADDYFGFSLADVGDVTGSGLDDVMIGAPGQDLDGAESGRAYVYAGGSGSYATAASLEILPATGIMPGTLPGDFYGVAVGTAGDFDDDGQPDLMVGAPRGNIRNNATSGYLHLMDSSDTVVPVFLAHWQATWASGGEVRCEFRLAEPTEAVAHLGVWRELQSDDGLELHRIALFEGPPLPNVLPLEIRGETWIFHDRPDPVPVAATLTYTLVLEMADGREVRLERLAGPPPVEPALAIELSPAQPNPFNPNTSLSFRSPFGQETVCRVVDMRGWHVATLFTGVANGQWQGVHWNGRSEDGRAAPAGIYLVQLIAGGRSESRRIVLAK
jgi:hypothetical protein